MIQPLQDMQYGTQFPQEKQTHNSLFVRTDLPGNRVYQYDAYNDVYVQIEGIVINVDFGITCTNVNFTTYNSIQINVRAGNPMFGFKGLTSDTLYRYRLISDWDTSLYTDGYIDPVPYAPTYPVDGHYVSEIQYDAENDRYIEVVIESSKTQNSRFAYGVGDIIGTYNTPLIETSSSGQGLSDNFVKQSGHQSAILFNNLSDFGASMLTPEQVSLASGGTK